MNTNWTNDAEFGRELWKFIRKDLNDCGLCLEIDTESLMQFAEKHGRACKVKYNPEIHGYIEVESGEEIWWWGDDASIL